jgi:cytidine deaminase
MDSVPDRKKLIHMAAAAAARAYVPASGFRVGAALAGPGGVHTGCNIENSSLGLSICAERVAIFKALSESVRDFKELVVVNDSGHDAPPCGACRQVLAELAPGLRVTYRQHGQLVTRIIEELLPDAFGGWEGKDG